MKKQSSTSDISSAERAKRLREIVDDLQESGSDKADETPRDFINRRMAEFSEHGATDEDGDGKKLEP